MPIKISILSTTEIKSISTQIVRSLIPVRFERASHFMQESDRLLCLCAGLLLRRAVGIEDESLIKYSANGKPYADGYPYFSISHSGSLAAVAVGEMPLGVDIQKIGQNRFSASRVFTDEERQWLNGRSDGDFYRLWTYKEALAKATDTPLMQILKKVSILPLIDEGKITFCGKEYFGAQEKIGEYVLACCAEEDFGEMVVERVELEIE